MAVEQVKLIILHPSFFVCSRRLTATNMIGLLGMPLGLFIGAIKLMKLGETGENKMIEKLTDIFDAAKIKDE